MYRLGALVAALAVLPPLTRGVAPGVAAGAVALLSLAAGFSARGRWWIFRTGRADVYATVTGCCRRILAPCSAEGGGIAVRLGPTPLTIMIQPLAGSSFTIRFIGPWRAGRKATLLQQLIAKQYEPPVPRIRIRMRGPR